MMLGPLRAPSSPPDTPQPTKFRSCSRSACSRRRVSMKCALPQSTTMSPWSSSGTSSSMTASVAGPAWTMMMMARGRSRLATKSLIDSLGRNVPSSPWSLTRLRVRSGERLCRATVWVWRARSRARLRPITPRPVTPMSACWLPFWLASWLASLMRSLLGWHGSLTTFDPNAWRPAPFEGGWPPGCDRVGVSRLRQGPLLVGAAGAVPDLELRARGRRPACVVETLVGLRVVQLAVGLGDEHLRAGAVAVVQVHRGPVGCPAAVDIQALPEGVQGAARLDHRPLLGVGPAAGVDLHRGEVGAVRAADVDAQAAVTDDRAGGAGRRRWRRGGAAGAAGAGGGVGRDVLHAHRPAGRGGTRGRRAVADAVRVAAAHGQVEDDRHVVVERGLPGGGADLGLGDLEVLVAVQVEGDRLVRGVGAVLDHRVGVVAGLAARAGAQAAADAVGLVARAAGVGTAVHGAGQLGQGVDVFHDVDLAVFRPLARPEHPEGRPVTDAAARVGLLDRGGDLELAAGRGADVGRAGLDSAGGPVAAGAVGRDVQVAVPVQ